MQMLLLSDADYMEAARLARKHADCKGRHVGAVVVLPTGIIITGWNGTPDGLVKCMDGGCYRCSRPDAFSASTGYDVCACVHAEERALLLATRSGYATEGARVYSTMRPCRECSKLMLQAGVRSVYYEQDWVPKDPEQVVAYLQLQAGFPDGIHQVVTRTITIQIPTTEVPVRVPASNVK